MYPLLTPLLAPKFEETALLLTPDELLCTVRNVNTMLKFNAESHHLVKSFFFLHHDDRPFFNMWKNYEGFLCLYGCIIYRRLVQVNPNVSTIFNIFEDSLTSYNFIIPSWWTNEKKRDKIISSHIKNRANPLSIPYSPSLTKPARG